MRDRSYRHPLYSLDLIDRDADLAALDLPAFPVAEGRLLVKPGLLNRGRHLSTAACHRAVLRALRFHAAHGLSLSHKGLDDEWAANMMYWAERMLEISAERYLIDLRLRHLARQRTDELNEGRLLLQQLFLSARLANVSALLPGGALSRTGPGLLAQIAEVLRRLDGDRSLREALVRRGYGEEQLRALSQVAGAVAGWEAKTLDLRIEHGRLGERLMVIRAALIGDLRQFSQLVQAHYPAILAEPLRIQRLLLA